jgi:hypothetical protein
MAAEPESLFFRVKIPVIFPPLRNKRLPITPKLGVDGFGISLAHKHAVFEWKLFNAQVSAVEETTGIKQ